MTFPRRTFLQHAAGSIAFVATCRTTWAVDYPTRPVHVVVGYPAGSNTPDVVARIVGQPLAERFGQPVVVDNRPGAASNIGAESVVRAPPDGYTLFWQRRPMPSTLHSDPARTLPLWEVGEIALDDDERERASTGQLGPARALFMNSSGVLAQ
jgi:tripartite-type tricarboxylate transporter receptor subunit TctC